MKVRATYVFDFEPDTSSLDDNVDKKAEAEVLARIELTDMLNRGSIVASDFTYEVTDDNDDHAIGDGYYITSIS